MILEKKKKLFIVMGCMILFIAVIFSLTLGSYHISLYDVLRTLLGAGTKKQVFTIYQLRLPRICIALVVATALSCAGIVFQNITRNSLAEPGMIGINAGAAFGVVSLITLKRIAYYSNLSVSTILLMPVVAIIGAFLAAILVYMLSCRKGKGIAPVRLLLVGIGVNSALNAVITLMQLKLSKGSFNEVFTWTNGSLWGSSWIYVKMTAPIVFLLLFAIIVIYKRLDVMVLGDSIATGLGINVSKNNILLFCLGTALAGTATAVAGNIAFLGLLGPHIARRMVGPKHKYLVPMSAIVSGIILLLADVISRNLFTPLEIPVGITISIIGVPYFVFLMFKEKA